MLPKPWEMEVGSKISAGLALYCGRVEVSRSCVEGLVDVAAAKNHVANLPSARAGSKILRVPRVDQLSLAAQCVRCLDPLQGVLPVDRASKLSREGGHRSRQVAGVARGFQGPKTEGRPRGAGSRAAGETAGTASGLLEAPLEVDVLGALVTFTLMVRLPKARSSSTNSVGSGPVLMHRPPIPRQSVSLKGRRPGMQFTNKGSQAAPHDVPGGC